jgi:hypothetical protein
MRSLPHQSFQEPSERGQARFLLDHAQEGCVVIAGQEFWCDPRRGAARHRPHMDSSLVSLGRGRVARVLIAREQGIGEKLAHPLVEFVGQGQDLEDLPRSLLQGSAQGFQLGEFREHCLALSLPVLRTGEEVSEVPGLFDRYRIACQDHGHEFLSSAHVVSITSYSFLRSSDRSRAVCVTCS